MDIVVDNINTANGGVIFGQVLLAVLVGAGMCYITRKLDTTIQMSITIFVACIASAVPVVIGADGNLAVSFMLGIFALGIWGLYSFLSR